MRAVCNQTLRIFDANDLYDLKLRYRSSKGHLPAGFSGPVATCSARYVPISGHAKGSSSVRKLADNKSMTISFARLGETNAFLTSELSLKIGFGRLIVKAR